METKEQLIKCVKEWVRIDNELRTLQKEQAKKVHAKLLQNWLPRAAPAAQPT